MFQKMVFDNVSHRVRIFVDMFCQCEWRVRYPFLNLAVIWQGTKEIIFFLSFNVTLDESHRNAWLNNDNVYGQILGRLALFLFLPVWVWQDGSALWDGAAPVGGWARGGSLLVADGLLAWLQAVAAFSVLSRVTPLAYAVASAAKRAAVVGASLLLLGNPAPPLNLAGMALALLGVLAYNRAKIAARERAPRLPLPVWHPPCYRHAVPALLSRFLVSR